MDFGGGTPSRSRPPMTIVDRRTTAVLVGRIPTRICERFNSGAANGNVAIIVLAFEFRRPLKQQSVRLIRDSANLKMLAVKGAVEDLAAIIVGHEFTAGGPP